MGFELCFLLHADTPRLQLFRKDEIGAGERANLKGARADGGESVAVIEVERTVIAVVHAEQQAVSVERTSVGESEIEERLGGS